MRGLGGLSPRPDFFRPLREARTDEELDKCLYHDLRVYLPQLLAMEDRMSMAVSLESRVPLLDHRIVELLARTPPTLKVRERQPKRLLREVARPLLPPSIVDRRDKTPFPIPLEQWFADNLFGAASDLLKSERSLDRGVLHPDRLREKTIPPSLAWQIINIELWYRICVDRDPKWVEQTKLLTSDPVGPDPARYTPSLVAGLPSLRRAMAEGRATLGYLVTMPSVPLVQALARTGVDWLMLDMEHAAVGIESIAAMIAATVAPRRPPWCECRGHGPSWSSRSWTAAPSASSSRRSPPARTRRPRCRPSATRRPGGAATARPTRRCGGGYRTSTI